ncbi:MAG: glycoside hydrolase family 2 TIM barrel-domain containing protein [Kiritimatiellae bacterium]|nr:glycoside hydrolase family 2 TIM barrel-domain containing protein [Kiritimatiellia bacterium]
MNIRGLLVVIFGLACAGLASGAGIQINACRQLAAGPAYHPDLSADGKLLVFSTTASMPGKIVVLNLAAGSSNVIHDAGMFPEFSPDGKKICFATCRKYGADSVIAVMNADGSDVQQLTTNQYSTSPHWAPDGRSIYYIALQDKKIGVFIRNIKTGEQRVVSQRNEMDAVPSPDGKYLAFVIVEPKGSRALGVMGTDGSNPRLLMQGTTVPSSGYFEPRWSPDGKWIVMVYSQMQPLDNLVAVSIDGRQRVTLTADSGQSASPSWSRDGKTIVFGKLLGHPQPALYQMDVTLDSAGIEDRLASLGAVYNPADREAVAEALPALAGPDVKAPLDVEPIPGVVESVCLNGCWEAVTKSTNNIAPENGWVAITVPAHSAAPAWFKVKFVVPAEYQKAPYAELYITCVSGDAKYYMNGAPVGESALSDLPVRLRVDQKLLWGRTNELQVFLKQGKIDPRDTGIRGDIFMKFYPALYVDNIIVTTSVRKQTIESRVYVRNLSKHPTEATVTGDVIGEDGEVALRFEPQPVKVPAGTMTDVVFTQAWTNPVLWGFGLYGKPYLYSMRHRLEQGRAIGEGCARFGFREFWGEGPHFMLNGKALWIKGDHPGSLQDEIQNRGFVQRYSQFLREGNMNFIRHHTWTFGNDVWFDVADEVGILMETQLYMTEGSDAQWRNFIWTHANHPSIVMYSADNESLSGCLIPVPDLYARMNQRGKLLNTLDPTRLVEWHGDPALGIAAAMGLYDNLQVFNSHPYSMPLSIQLKKDMQECQYNGQIPVHVGELYVGHGASPFNWWTMAGEVKRSEKLQRIYEITGDEQADMIRSVASVGACGVTLCSSVATLQFGPDGKGGVAFGPWQKEALRTDRLTKDGKPVVPGELPPKGSQVVNAPSVQIPWPSLSGKGMRTTSMGAGASCGPGNPLMNWFDPSRAAYTFNSSMLKVRAAFRDVDGIEPGPLAETLAPEVVVCLAPDEVPAVGAFVKVTPLKAQSAPADSVMTDPQGAAWFTLQSAGRYRASATWNGKTYTTEFVAEKRPFPPRETSGYGHVQWVDLAGNASKNLSALLARPAVVTVSNPKEIVYVPEAAVIKKPRAASTNYAAGPFQPDAQGFIRNWLVCGPFPNAYDFAKTNWTSFSTDFLQSAGGESAVVPAFGTRLKVVFPAGQSWKSGTTEVFWDYLASRNNRMELEDILSAPEMDISKPLVNVVGYAACYLQMESDMDVQLAMGFDDGGQAILNGKTVGLWPDHGAAIVDEATVSVHLNKGRNRLLLKIDQSVGGYAFYCRLLKDNKPVTNYTVYLKAE